VVKLRTEGTGDLGSFPGGGGISRGYRLSLGHFLEELAGWDARLTAYLAWLGLRMRGALLSLLHTYSCRGDS
jgi:hypothetical protein